MRHLYKQKHRQEQQIQQARPEQQQIFQQEREQVLAQPLYYPRNQPR